MRGARPAGVESLEVREEDVAFGEGGREDAGEEDAVDESEVLCGIEGERIGIHGCPADDECSVERRRAILFGFLVGWQQGR